MFRWFMSKGHAPLAIVIYGLSGCTLFVPSPHKLHCFRIKVAEHRVWGLKVCTAFVILRRNQRDIIKVQVQVHRASCKVLFVLLRS